MICNFPCGVLNDSVKIDPDLFHAKKQNTQTLIPKICSQFQYSSLCSIYTNNKSHGTSQNVHSKTYSELERFPFETSRGLFRTLSNIMIELFAKIVDYIKTVLVNVRPVFSDFQRKLSARKERSLFTHHTNYWIDFRKRWKIKWQGSGLSVYCTC